MTIAETAKILGLKVRTIRYWLKTGKLKAEKRGKAWYIYEEQLNTAEVRNRANKGRERSKRIKAGIELGMLAGAGKNTKEPV